MDILNNIYFLIFAGVSLLILVYYSIFYLPIGSSNKLFTASKKMGISVIIPARNQARTIEYVVEEIVKQKYPEFEIIIVNDRSWDGTISKAQNLEEKYPDKIKLVNILENNYKWIGKKFAITLGVKAAKYEHIVITHANCVPESVFWLESYAAAFSTPNKKNDIVVSYSSYPSTQKFSEFLIDLENCFKIKEYLGWANVGCPVLGTSRNMGFTKTVFMQNNGFMNNIRLSEGEDALFLQENANSKNTRVLYNPESTVFALNKTSFSKFLKNKKRQLKVYPDYNFCAKFAMNSILFLEVVFFALATFMIVTKDTSIEFLAVTTFVVIYTCIINYRVAKELNQTMWSIFGFLFSPFLALFEFTFLTLSFLSGLFVKKH